MIKIWLELENIDDTHNAEAATLMTEVLRKLAQPSDRAIFPSIVWSKTAREYIKIDTHSGMFTSLVDNGEWFNLEYLAKSE